MTIARRTMLMLTAAAYVTVVACGTGDQTGERNRGQDWREFTATAYSVDGETSTGNQTREGHTVAADPSVLPPGTRIRVEDADEWSGVYVVDDSGPKVKGRRLDIFIANGRQAKQFGRKQVRVLVLDSDR